MRIPIVLSLLFNGALGKNGVSNKIFNFALDKTVNKAKFQYVYKEEQSVCFQHWNIYFSIIIISFSIRKRDLKEILIPIFILL